MDFFSLLQYPITLSIENGSYVTFLSIISLQFYQKISLFITYIAHRVDYHYSDMGPIQSKLKWIPVFIFTLRKKKHLQNDYGSQFLYCTTKQMASLKLNSFSVLRKMKLYIMVKVTRSL